MREHLIGFIKAMQEKLLADPNCRPELMLTGTGEESAGIQFGYGYFDLGKVVWDGRGKTDDADDDCRKVMAVEAAVDRFLEHYGLEG